jgi:hypothetical protein
MAKKYQYEPKFCPAGIPFGQITYFESLRDIEARLRSVGGRLYHAGLRGKGAHSTLAGANDSRDWDVQRLCAGLDRHRSMERIKTRRVLRAGGRARNAARGSESAMYPRRCWRARFARAFEGASIAMKPCRMATHRNPKNRLQIANVYAGLNRNDECRRQTETVGTHG